MNPKKGFYHTANQRIVPENSKFDFGATQVNTARAIRIGEIISEGIRQGKKFDAQDMVDIQQDLVDVVARELSPHIVKIAEKVVSDPEHAFSKDQITDIKKMIEQLRNFDGKMNEESISATVYNYWQYFFYRSLMHKYTSAGKNEKMKTLKEEVDGKMEVRKFWSTARRLGVVDNYTFMEFY